jgi:hypothetical protein
MDNWKDVDIGWRVILKWTLGRKIGWDGVDRIDLA